MKGSVKSKPYPTWLGEESSWQPAPFSWQQTLSSHLRRGAQAPFTSLDDYVADESGNFDWAELDEEVHAWPRGEYYTSNRTA